MIINKVSWIVILILSNIAIAQAGGWEQPVDIAWTGKTFTGTHLGIDWGNSIGTEVRAIAYGYDVQLLYAGDFGGCDGSSGYALFIKHRKSDGSYFWALYGHVKNAVSSGPISAGQKIAEIADYDPCYHWNSQTNDWDCRTPGCPHLHFGIWNDSGFPTAPYGYGSQRSYEDPVTFMANNEPWDSVDVCGCPCVP